MDVEPVHLSNTCTVTACGLGWVTHRANRAEVVPAQLLAAPPAADVHERVAPRAEALPALLPTALYIHNLPQQNCGLARSHDALPKQRARARNIAAAHKVVSYTKGDCMP